MTPLIALLFASLLLASAGALRTGASPRLRRPGLRMAGYEEMLAQARAARAAKRASPGPKTAPRAVTSASSSNAPRPVTRADPSPAAPVRSQTSSGLPFSDEMYGHLKFCLEKLAARMKSDRPLSSSDLRRFRESVEAIIADLNTDEVMTASSGASGKASAPKAKHSPQSSPGSKRQSVIVADDALYEPGEEPAGYYGPPDEDSPFSLFHGTRSTWAIQGMEKMDSETYYRKINERNTAIKQMRKERGERIGAQSTEEYFDFLAKKNRNGADEQKEP